LCFDEYDNELKLNKYRYLKGNLDRIRQTDETKLLVTSESEIFKTDQSENNLINRVRNTKQMLENEDMADNI